MRTKNKNLNVKLLRRIQKHILQEPRRFFMNWVIARSFGLYSKVFPSDNGTLQRFGPCGTAACIAGWANLFTKSEPENFVAAVEALGLDSDEQYNGSHAYLFDVPYWPEPFQSRYKKAMTPRKRAKIACERIDFLIKTGE